MSNQTGKVHVTQQESVIGRIIEPGINWVWYVTDSREDAEAWYEELFGAKLRYEWLICEVRSGRFGFRLHR